MNRNLLITESYAVSQLFLKLSFIIALYYESLKISYSVGIYRQILSTFMNFCETSRKDMTGDIWLHLACNHLS